MNQKLTDIPLPVPIQMPKLPTIELLKSKVLGLVPSWVSELKFPLSEAESKGNEAIVYDTEPFNGIHEHYFRREPINATASLHSFVGFTAEGEFVSKPIAIKLGAERV